MPRPLFPRRHPNPTPPSDLRGAVAISRRGGIQPRVPTPCPLSPCRHLDPTHPRDPRGAAATSRRGATHSARRTRWPPTARAPRACCKLATPFTGATHRTRHTRLWPTSRAPRACCRLATPSTGANHRARRARWRLTAKVPRARCRSVRIPLLCPLALNQASCTSALSSLTLPVRAIQAHAPHFKGASLCHLGFY